MGLNNKQEIYQNHENLKNIMIWLLKSSLLLFILVNSRIEEEDLL